MLNDEQDLTLKQILSNPDSAKEYSWGTIQILTTERTKPYTDKEKQEHCYIDDNGELEVWLSDELDFRKRTDCLYTPYDKWLIMLCRYADHPDKVNELIEIAKDFIPKCKKVIIKQESLRNADISNNDKYFLSDWLDATKITLKEFITNPAYVIFISSDRIFEDLISSGIINAKFIKEYADEYSMEEE